MARGEPSWDLLVDRRVLVIGAGPIGALITAVTEARSAAQVWVTDLHPAALDRVRALGASQTILATDTTAVAAVDADLTFECSGSVHGLRAAIDATTRGGRVVMVGLLPPGEHPVAVSKAIARELDLVGAFRFNDDEIDDVLWPRRPRHRTRDHPRVRDRRRP